MTATVKTINVPDGPWFEAKWPGRCAECDELFPAGAMVRYNAAGFLVTTECGIADLPDTFVVTDNSKTPANVMPPGRTKADRCPRCFIIHTTAQGDECQ